MVRFVVNNTFLSVGKVSSNWYRLDSRLKKQQDSPIFRIRKLKISRPKLKANGVHSNGSILMQIFDLFMFVTHFYFSNPVKPG